MFKAFSERQLFDCGNRIPLSCKLFLSLQYRQYGRRNKIYSVSDAVGLVRNSDTVSVSGFVCQGAPEALLRGLGDRFEKTGSPKNLTLLFGGGPGDYDSKGLNHFAKPGMIRRAIGGHYGQVPALAKMAINNEIEAYCVPMGSFSRMLRASASEVPGHLTKVGIGTFVDPRISGGRLNEKSKEHSVVEVVNVLDEEFLLYKAIPINVAIIRATTGDNEGNLSFERESLYTDARVIAMAARSSGGVVLAQVERIANPTTIPMRSVQVPGALVDCVVLAERSEDSHMSYFTHYNPSWSGEIIAPMASLGNWPLDKRKIIARRSALELELDQIVNLGIGMPEGIATVSREEGIFQDLTLTTEAGVFGGVGASGHDFGPASCPTSMFEMNQQFDFYNGGGLDICFLGMAECGQNGDVNVSRLTDEHLTGPGGFIDITQCTRVVVFMGTFRKSGLDIQLKDGSDGKRNLNVIREGKFATFKRGVREITFSSKVALERGQTVMYVTERAVFKLSSRGLKLIEVAPGVDIDKDILAQMEFMPIVDREKIVTMESRIFENQKMGLQDDMLSVEKNITHRLDYAPETNTAYLDLSGVCVSYEGQLREIFEIFRNKLDRITDRGARKVNMVVNYDRFDISDDLDDEWTQLVSEMATKYYVSVTRYAGRAFWRHRLSTKIDIQNADCLWLKFNEGQQDCDFFDRKGLCNSLLSLFHLKVTPDVLNRLMLGKKVIKKSDFPNLLERIEGFINIGIVELSEDEEESLLSGLVQKE